MGKKFLTLCRTNFTIVRCRRAQLYKNKDNSNTVIGKTVFSPSTNYADQKNNSQRSLNFLSLTDTYGKIYTHQLSELNRFPPITASILWTLPLKICIRCKSETLQDYKLSTSSLKHIDKLSNEITVITEKPLLELGIHIRSFPADSHRY